MTSFSEQKIPLEAWSLAQQAESLRMLQGCPQPQAPDYYGDRPPRACTQATQKAIEGFTEAISIAQKQGVDYIWAIAHRGATYWQLRRWDQAIEDLEYAIEKIPNYAWAYAQLGQIFYLKALPWKKLELREIGKAIYFFEKAITINPRFAWAYAHLGAVYCVCGDYKNFVGDSQGSQDDYEKGIGFLNKAVELTEGSYAWAYANLWSCYLGLGNYEKALENKKQAEALDPLIFLYPRYQTGMTYYLCGQYDKAMESYEEQLREHPDDPLALYGIALAKWSQTNLDEARPAIERARNVLHGICQRQPDDCMAPWQLAGLAIVEGNREEASKYWQQAEQNRANPLAEGKLATFLEHKDLNWLGLPQNQIFQELILQPSEA